MLPTTPTKLHGNCRCKKVEKLRGQAKLTIEAYKTELCELNHEITVQGGGGSLKA